MSWVLGCFMVSRPGFPTSHRWGGMGAEFFRGRIDFFLGIPVAPFCLMTLLALSSVMPRVWRLIRFGVLDFFPPPPRLPRARASRMSRMTSLGLWLMWVLIVFGPPGGGALGGKGWRFFGRAG